MELINITLKSGNIYTIGNESWSNYNGWGHESRLFNKNGYELAKNRVKYLNRTWECYTYQSCMYGLISNYKNELLNEFMNDYKNVNNITRFRRGEKDEVIKTFEETEKAKDLAELYDRIKNRNFK